MYVSALSQVIFGAPLAQRTATPTPTYDRTPPRDIADYPKCATQAQHDAAHAACKPIATSPSSTPYLRGLGLYNLSTANPCWVETLPICPTSRPWAMWSHPATTPAPAPVIPKPVAPPPPAATGPTRVLPIATLPRPPVPRAYIPPPPGTAEIPPLPPIVRPPPSKGISTGGLLAIAAGVAIGGWFLFGKKKKKPAAAAAA